jgi:hypothetical protein
MIARLATAAGVPVLEPRTFAEASQEIQRLRQLDPMVAAVIQAQRAN